MATVITVTLNPALDKSSEVEQLIPNEKLRCTKARTDPGGGGVNVSRVLAELGHDSLAIYTQGDVTGALLSQLLEQTPAVARQPILIKQPSRENLLMIETSTGHQFRFGMPGPELAESEWRKTLETVKKCITEETRFVIGSGSLPVGVPSDFYWQLSEIVSQHKAKFILDTSGEALSQGILGQVYLLKPNLRELRQLVDKPLENEIEQEEAAEALVSEGKCEVVILSLSAAGALVVSKGAKIRLRSPTVKMVSKVGAGDSMIGGIAYGLLQNMSLADAARYGIACGASTVTSPGTELCKREKVEELFQRIID